jgi:ribosome-binding factor A
MSHRLAQIESTLKRALAQVLSQQLSDPRVAGMVSITRITVSPDLHDAYVYVSIIPARYQKRTMFGLRHATVHIHALLCQAVRMRNVPHLEFRLDESLKRQAEVDLALRRAAARGGTATPTDPAPPAAGATPADPSRPQESAL